MINITYGFHVIPEKVSQQTCITKMKKITKKQKRVLIIAIFIAISNAKKAQYYLPTKNYN